MNDYEILLMLDPELSEERQNEILTRIRELVERGGGAWVKQEPWGRRRLAYPIEKKNDGIYYLLEFDATTETLDELSRILKITDDVLRHMAVHRVHSTHAQSGPPPQEPAVTQPAYAGANDGQQEEE